MQVKFPELWQFVFRSTFSKCFAVFVVLGALLFFVMDTAQISFIVNKSIASTRFDSLMVPYTDLASGWVFLIFAIGALLFSSRYSVMVCVCGILVLISIMLFKRVIFSDEMRPTVEFGLHNFSHVMENYRYLERYSFPSGHTMAAFAVAGLLSFFIKNKWAQLLFFVYAVLIAFSRIYLLHHFYRDVFWGAIIAYCIVSILLLCYSFFKRIPNRGILWRSAKP